MPFIEIRVMDEKRRRRLVAHTSPTSQARQPKAAAQVLAPPSTLGRPPSKRREGPLLAGVPVYARATWEVSR